MILKMEIIVDLDDHRQDWRLIDVGDDFVYKHLLLTEEKAGKLIADIKCISDRPNAMQKDEGETTMSCCYVEISPNNINNYKTLLTNRSLYVIDNKTGATIERIN